MNDIIELRAMKNEFEDRDATYDAEDYNEAEENCVRPNYKKMPQKNPAGRLQMKVPDAPENLLELIYTKKCTECNSYITSISSAIAHYNSSKHQTKLAFLFMPFGNFYLQLSKDELREIETGVSKKVILDKYQKGKQQMTLRDLLKKFEITEDIKKLNLEHCRLCRVSFPTKISALHHYSGTKHKENFFNDLPYNPLSSNRNAELRCDVCNHDINESLPIEEHLTSKKHQVKLRRYMDQVNTGDIIPPMSTRGFYDFNNVEREEANPFDASKFMQEIVIPTNLMGPSFAAAVAAVVRNDNIQDQPMMYDNSMFQAQMPGQIQGGFINDFKQPMHQQQQQQMQPQQHQQPVFGTMGHGYSMGPSAQYHGGQMTTGFVGQAQVAADSSQAAFREGRMPPMPSWSNQVPHGGTAATATTATVNTGFATRLGSKGLTLPFGPTKFKYTKKH